VALNGAPGREGPASGNDGGSGVAMQCIETVGRCRVSVKRCAGSRKKMRNTWIPDKVGGGRPIFTSLSVAITARFVLTIATSQFYIYSSSYPVSIELQTTHSEDRIHNTTANSRTLHDNVSRNRYLCVKAHTCTKTYTTNSRCRELVDDHQQ
jgi:hypothetical protein